MPGKEIGEFSFKIASLTFSSGPDDSVLLQLNYEGRALNSIIALTVTLTPGKSGSYTAYGAQYLDNGDTNTTKSSGSYEGIGTHRWRTQGDVVISDGRTIHTEREVDLANQSWSGKVFEG